jgi:hypothetical protein
LGYEVDFSPYARSYEQYLLPIIREPDRFNLLLVIPLSVIAGWGMNVVFKKLDGMIFRYLAVALVVVFIFFDSIIWPHHFLSAKIPAWYDSLADDPDDYGLLEIPMERQRSEWYMFYQLTHQKALVYGHVSRLPREAYRFIDHVPLLAYLDDHSGSHLPTYPLHITEQLRMLHDVDIPYLVLHRDSGTIKFLDDRDISFWRRFLVTAPIYEDDEVIIYSTDPELHLQMLGEMVGGRTAVTPMTAQISSPETIPGGWVVLKMQWYVPSMVASAGRDLCLGLADDDGQVVQWTCDYTFLGESDAALAPGLMQMDYLFRVAPEVKDGVYSLVFRQGTDEAGGLTEGQGFASMDLTLTVQADPDRFQPPSPSSVMDVTFGDKIALVGYDLLTDNADSLQLQLYWHALVQPDTSYKVFVHLLDSETGMVAVQSDHVPVNWQYPSDIWAKGEYVQDPVTLDLSRVDPGRYDLLVGLYLPESGERLNTRPVYQDNAVLLTPIQR